MPESPDFDQALMVAARRVGRETLWSASEAALQIRAGVAGGISIDQAEQLLRLNISVVFVVKHFRLEP